MIYIPCLEELVFAAIGYGAWYQKGEAPWKKAHVSKVADLRDGVFLVSQVDNFGKRGAFESYLDLESKAYITRSWGDGYGYLLVATGRAEVMVDPIVSPWMLLRFNRSWKRLAVDVRVGKGIHNSWWGLCRK